MKQYDVVVVGAGSAGSAAAYHLAKEGKRVLLLEQFRIGHRRGSSHGGSRIIRHSHAEQEYASMVPAAIAYWRALEQESNVSLLKMTGGLDFGPAGFGPLEDRIGTMQALGYPYEVLDGEELARRYPQFVLPEDWIGLYQAEAGILSASRAVSAMVQQAQAHGATLEEESRVGTVRADGAGVCITVDGPHGHQTISAARVILTPGPWVQYFLDELGLASDDNVATKVTHQQVVYFDVASESAHRYKPAVCPLYIFLPLPHFYGFPIWERPGRIKIGLELNAGDFDADSSERTVEKAAVEMLCGLVEKHLRGIVPVAAEAEACLYTHSPDQHAFIDRHPEYPQILLGGGFSGRGFKFSILSGRLLADLATSEAGDYSSPFWRDIFSLDRFVQDAPDGFIWDKTVPANFWIDG